MVRGPSLPIVLGGLAATLVGVEAYKVFADRHETFAISGRTKYDVTELGDQKVVSQAFLMRGAGLESVAIQLGSRTPASVRLRWVLSRGSLDYPPMTPAAEGERQLLLRPGHQWTTFDVVRDGSSHDRWYTLDLQLLDASTVGSPDPRPTVSVTASRDNPDRGGVLFVDGIRQPGSLALRANRQGATIYRRFLAEAAPNLPPPLRLPAVQWLVAVALHWAFMSFAYAVIKQSVIPSLPPVEPDRRGAIAP